MSKLVVFDTEEVIMSSWSEANDILKSILEKGDPSPKPKFEPALELKHRGRGKKPTVGYREGRYKKIGGQFHKVADEDAPDESKSVVTRKTVKP